MINFYKQLDQWGPIDARVLYPGFWFLPTAGLVGKNWGTYWSDVVGIYNRDRLTFYWEKNKMEKRGETAIASWILPDRKQKLLWQKYQLMLGRLKKLSQEIAQLEPGALFAKTAALADDWYNQLVDYWSLTNVFELANFSAPRFLRAKLKPFVPAERMSLVLEALLAPERLSFYQKSELELLRLGRKSDLADYAGRWQWLENSYYQSKKLSAAYFKKQINGFSAADINRKIKEIKNYPAGVKARKKAVGREYGLPSGVMKTAARLAFSIWWQDHRKGVAWWSHPYTDILSHLAVRRYKLSFSDILYYLAEEWRDLFVKGVLVSPQILKARKKFFVVHMHNCAYDVYLGEKARAFVRPFLRLRRHQAGGVITGTPVSRGQGVERGRVRVLLSPQQADKMKTGEILVAPMTSPDYILAMRQAAAIITDVGGLMSHAAVVARELGIPCVVGTKIATKVLKDGDLVEVDAERGIVRKLDKQ